MKKFTIAASIFAGTLISLWSGSTLLMGLAEANWSVSELMRQYFVAIGLVQEFHTMSDFYTYIKGVEYIIAASFLVTFPLFFKYLNGTERAKEVA